MPVFFDAGLIILIPLAFLAKENQTFLPVLCHPPAGRSGGRPCIYSASTPGPVLVATMLGVDLGWVIMVGIVCGILP